MPAMLIGRGTSAGVWSGRVRLVRVASDVARVSQGDVVVTRSASAELALLLQVAGALVCESGSPLCNLATIARESEVPMVTGIDGVLAILRDGDILTVDGGSGTVYQCWVPERRIVELTEI